MDCPVISSSSCIFILDENLNLLAGSQTTNHEIRWHEALLFKDNRLVGINGVRESRFRETIFNGHGGTKNILLKAAQDGDTESRLLLKVTPLSSPSSSTAQNKTSTVCIEVQTLDTFYSDAVKRVAEKYNLTKAETLVLKYLMMGLSSDQIKERMMIGTPTLRTHQQRLRQKTGESSSFKTIMTALNPENHIDHLIELEEF
jgi:DNA-binding CsgD family transcriptional regulator